jgi:hypothetical protein
MKVCPGCSVTFEPVPPSRVYCRPSCKVRHEHQQRRLFVAELELTTELPAPREPGPVQLLSQPQPRTAAGSDFPLYGLGSFGNDPYAGPTSPDLPKRTAPSRFRTICHLNGFFRAIG